MFLYPTVALIDIIFSFNVHSIFYVYNKLSCGDKKNIGNAIKRRCDIYIYFNTLRNNYT